jgi:Na+-transporting methylmalonyl-CoA/oxaloacetate decarboxylase gamma subunit
MSEIDWNIVVQVAGLGFVVLFIVIGVVTLVVWLVSFGINKIAKNKVSKK